MDRLHVLRCRHNTARQVVCYLKSTYTVCQMWQQCLPVRQIMYCFKCVDEFYVTTMCPDTPNPILRNCRAMFFKRDAIFLYFRYILIYLTSLNMNKMIIYS